jgi:hypothetical protein
MRFHHTFFILGITIALLNSCVSKQENAQQEIDERLGKWPCEIANVRYVRLLENFTPSVENDTILLGYVLGWDRKTCENHTRHLVNQQSISPLQVQTVPTFTGSFSSWRGHTYKFLIHPELWCEGFINFAFEEDSLRYLRFFITSPIENATIQRFISKKYGKPSYGQIIDSLRLNEVLIWLSGGKEIQLFESEGNPVIQYSSIKSRLRDERLIIKETMDKLQEDSLHRDKLRQTAETSHNVF